MEPFRLLDCSLVSDYAGAFIVTRRELAQDLGGTEILIAAAGEQHNHRFIHQADLTATGARLVAARLWEVGRKVDALELAQRCRKLSPKFAPPAAFTAELAEYARSIGRHRLADDLSVN